MNRREFIKASVATTALVAVAPMALAKTAPKKLVDLSRKIPAVDPSWDLSDLKKFNAFLQHNFTEITNRFLLETNDEKTRNSMEHILTSYMKEVQRLPHVPMADYRVMVCGVPNKENDVVIQCIYSLKGTSFLDGFSMHITRGGMSFKDARINGTGYYYGDYK
jgi:hypothetical protein